MTQIRIVPFGGCSLVNPLGDLSRRGVAPSLFHEMGFRWMPYAHSCGAAIQLIEFCRGNKTIPHEVRTLCYADPDIVPTGEKSKVIDTGDVILIELSTPIEMVYGDYILNNNRVSDGVVASLKNRGDDLGRLAARWRNQGMQRMNETVRADTVARILELLSDDEEDDAPFLRDIIAKTVSRETKTDTMIADLATIRDDLKLPMGMILHNFNYMPDGRPVSWPVDFRDNSIAAAKHLGIPFYDPAVLVEKYGAAVAMMNDMRHYSPELTPVVADLYYEFVEQVMERPAVSA